MVNDLSRSVNRSGVALLIPEWIERRPFVDAALFARRLYHSAVIRRLVYLPSDLALRVRRRRTGTLTPPKGLVAVGPGNYEQIGAEFLDHFVRLGHLTPQDRVLDVGCGVGRMAATLTSYLSARGAYEGFDVVPSGVEWCQAHITPRHGNFQFRTVDIFNKTYNPRGRVAAEEFEFPYESDSFDFVFMTSVFTHMMPNAVERYLQETARVLRKGRRALITWFILNDESKTLIQDGVSQMSFPHERGRFSVMDEKLPEMNVAFEESFVRHAYSRAGMRISEPISWGGWCGRPHHLSFQDVVIGEKA
jgi:SAM-dependent methyltransferase